MKRIIHLDTWERKDHFLFFKDFDEPFWGVTVNVDCTRAFQKSREQQLSFFLSYLYCSLKAANETEAFRYRMENQEVACYDQVHASPTVLRPDGTFGFAYIHYNENKEAFLGEAAAEIRRIQTTKELSPAVKNENVIHYSTLLSLHFTALSHARNYVFKDSIPKITFGKAVTQNAVMLLPVSIHVNHALVDGNQVEAFVTLFQQWLNE